MTAVLTGVLWGLLFDYELCVVDLTPAQVLAALVTILLVVSFHRSPALRAERVRTAGPVSDQLPDLHRLPVPQRRPGVYSTSSHSAAISRNSSTKRIRFSLGSLATSWTVSANISMISR